MNADARRGIRRRGCASARLEWRHGVFDLPRPFRLEAGGVLANPQVAWQCVGPPAAPLIVVLGGISAHRRPCAADRGGWWEAQAGRGRTLDITRHRLLSIDWLGGCAMADAAAAPAAASPRSAMRNAAWIAPDDLVISTADQARALLALLNRLGVRRVHLLVGASYGGNVAQQLAALLGERLRRLVLLSAAHRPAQFGVALRHIQRSILDLGAGSTAALALARELALLCYRTTEGVERRFAGEESRGGVIGWLRHHGANFSTRFAVAAYRRLGRSLDSHGIDPATIRVPTTVFAVREDLIVPLSLLKAYVDRAGGPCTLVEISSPHGHDAFLKETRAVSRVLAAALQAAP